jgi:F-type H+-transporting ATPase subunit gamma
VANLKSIRTRIGSVKSTQKITRAMKMVAGARLTKAQQRILALRPYAVRTGQVLANVTRAVSKSPEIHEAMLDHPLLARRPVKSVLLLVITSDRGLCGAFNANILRLAERMWNERRELGQQVQIAVIGRKGRDFFRRRKAPVYRVFSGVWDDLNLDRARLVARGVLSPFIRHEADEIILVYNEFKSAMTQRVVAEALFPLAAEPDPTAESSAIPEWDRFREYEFQPDKAALLERLVPMYVEISILRALHESMASELGARMTAMDAATTNASEMISKLTLDYNRARQAAITTELMEIISGAEALRG